MRPSWIALIIVCALAAPAGAKETPQQKFFNEAYASIHRVELARTSAIKKHDAAQAGALCAREISMINFAFDTAEDMKARRKWKSGLTYVAGGKKLTEKKLFAQLVAMGTGAQKWADAHTKDVPAAASKRAKRSKRAKHSKHSDDTGGDVAEAPEQPEPVQIMISSYCLLPDQTCQTIKVWTTKSHNKAEACGSEGDSMIEAFEGEEVCTSIGGCSDDPITSGSLMLCLEQ